MQLQELTTYEVKSHLKIARVRFVIADHADPTKRKEWIEGQISTEIPALSRCRRSVAVNVAGNRRHAVADATAQVRNEPARSSLKCGRRSR